MEIDRTTIKALSADTRLMLLRKLSARRKMPSELSRETGLAASTVVEHLRILENASLVERQAAGKKWVYYAVTDKGIGIIRPHTPISLVLSSLSGIALVGIGVGKLFVAPAEEALKSAAQTDLGARLESVPSAAQYAVPQGYDPFSVAAVLAGVAILSLSIILFRKRPKLPV